MNYALAHARAISRGLSFIASSQRNDGGFDVCFSPDQNEFVNLSPHSTIFAPSLIGKSLSIFTHKEALGIKSAIASWLINQRKDNAWTFNYWDKASPMYTQRSYPDDLDDTFCALSVLYDFNPDIFTGKAMADIANILFSAEASEGGPYRTWLVAQSGHPDICRAPAENNILAMSAIALPVKMSGLKSYNTDKAQKSII